MQGMSSWIAFLGVSMYEQEAREPFETGIAQGRDIDNVIIAQVLWNPTDGCP
jgi:hypothetical protein